MNLEPLTRRQIYVVVLLLCFIVRVVESYAGVDDDSERVPGGSTAQLDEYTHSDGFVDEGIELVDGDDDDFEDIEMVVDDLDDTASKSSSSSSSSTPTSLGFAMVCTMDGMIHGVNSDLDQRWTTSLGHPLIQSYQRPDTLASGRILPGEDGSLYILHPHASNVANGQIQRFQYSIPDVVARTPVHQMSFEDNGDEGAGIFIVGQKASKIFQIDTRNGDIVASFSTDDDDHHRSSSSDAAAHPDIPVPPNDNQHGGDQPPHGKNTVSIARHDYTVRAFDPESKEELWNLTYSKFAMPSNSLDANPEGLRYLSGHPATPGGMHLSDPQDLVSQAAWEWDGSRVVAAFGTFAKRANDCADLESCHVFSALLPPDLTNLTASTGPSSSSDVVHVKQVVGEDGEPQLFASAHKSFMDINQPDNQSPFIALPALPGDPGTTSPNQASSGNPRRDNPHPAAVPQDIESHSDHLFLPHTMKCNQDETPFSDDNFYVDDTVDDVCLPGQEFRVFQTEKTLPPEPEPTSQPAFTPPPRSPFYEFLNSATFAFTALVLAAFVLVIVFDYNPLRGKQEPAPSAQHRDLPTPPTGQESLTTQNPDASDIIEDSEDQYRVGKLSIFKDKIKGHGCQGTTVFEGSFGDRPVAVKRMLKSFFGSANKEINLLIRLDGHPNIVRYFAKEECRDFIYLALELCTTTLDVVVETRANRQIASSSEGGGDDDVEHVKALSDGPEKKPPLAKTTRRKRPSPPTSSSGRFTAPMDSTLDFIECIVGAIAHLHNSRIVHLDIKPQNILVVPKATTNPTDPADPMAVDPVRGDGASVGDAWQPKISDMGLGRRIGENTSSFRFTPASLLEMKNAPKRGSGAAGNNGAASSIVGVGTVGWRAPELLVGYDESSLTSAADGSPPGSEDDTRLRLSRKVDVFSLGCILQYILRPGEHPFGAIVYEREQHIIQGVPVGLEGLRDFPEVKALVGRMVARNPEERPTVEEVLEHPGLWRASKKLQFLIDLSDRLECEPLDSPFVHELESQADRVIGEDGWFTPLHAELRKDITENKYRKYNYASVRDLLRVIRNKKSHYRDLNGRLRNLLSPLPYGMLNMLCGPFPELILVCHQVATKTLAHEHDFRRYVGESSADRLAVKSRAWLDTVRQTLQAGEWYMTRTQWIHHNVAQNLSKMKKLNTGAPSNHKTSLCQHWESSGGTHCPIGAKCAFAHGMLELRVLPKISSGVGGRHNASRGGTTRDGQRGPRDGHHKSSRSQGGGAMGNPRQQSGVRASPSSPSSGPSSRFPSSPGHGPSRFPPPSPTSRPAVFGAPAGNGDSSPVPPPGFNRLSGRPTGSRSPAQGPADNLPELKTNNRWKL